MLERAVSSEFAAGVLGGVVSAGFTAIVLVVFFLVRNVADVSYFEELELLSASVSLGNVVLAFVSLRRVGVVGPVFLGELDCL